MAKSTTTTTALSTATLPAHVAQVSIAGNGNIVIEIGANPKGTNSASAEKKGNFNELFASTTGWGSQVLIRNPDGTVRSGTLRCTLSER